MKFHDRSQDNHAFRLEESQVQFLFRVEFERAAFFPIVIGRFTQFPHDVPIVRKWRLVFHLAPPAVLVAAERCPAHPVLSVLNLYIL